MAFAPIDLPIQQMLQTDFITDLSVIHNSNVLLLKDQFELLINNLEIDVNGFTIGTDNAIQSIRTRNLLLKDTGMLFQKGSGNTTIASLIQDGSFESEFNIDHIKMNRIPNSSINVDTITVNTVNTTAVTTSGATTVNGPLIQGGPLVESKETVNVLFEWDGVTDAVGTIVLSSTSKNNIFVNVLAETLAGGTQVYTGTAINVAIANFKLIIDFDLTSPPVENTTFTIMYADVQENSTNNSIMLDTMVPTFLPLTIEAGTNPSSVNPNLELHSGLAPSKTLGTNVSSTDLLAQANVLYNSGATFNYIIDSNSTERLMIKSMTGLIVY
jgi:hypothetical protein